MTVNSGPSSTYILHTARTGLCARYELLRMEFGLASQHFQRRSDSRWFVFAHAADVSNRVHAQTADPRMRLRPQSGRLSDFCGSVMQ
jgi:hypothetical protein